MKIAKIQYFFPVFSEKTGNFHSEYVSSLFIRNETHGKRNKQRKKQMGERFKNVVEKILKLKTR